MTISAIKARNYRAKRMHPCIYCGKPCHFTSEWCHSCGAKLAAEKRGLKLREPNFCIDCHNSISPEAKRCRDCSNKHNAPKMRGSTSPRWKGGRHIRKDGYAMLIDPSGSGIRTLEHRLVWEQTHKREIPKGWIVHHLNGIKSDNRPENLIAVPEKKHNKMTFINALQKRIRELEQLHLL